MKSPYISLPFSVQLTNEEAWDPLDEKEQLFFVVRFHFYLRSRQTHEPHRVGNKLAVFEFPEGASQEHVTSIECQREDIKLESTIRNSLIQNDLIVKHIQELAASAKVAGIAEIRGKMQNEITAQLKTSFSKTYRVDDTAKERVTVKYEVKNTLADVIQKPVVAVSVFQRHAIDIQLAWMDYLLVKYQRRYFGLRKRKTTYPRVENATRHPNRIMCHTPLATIHYWRHLWQSSKLVYEDGYRSQVLDPDEMTVAPPEPVPLRRVPFPKVATLYQIARAAFPRRWINRSNSQWTEKELMEIELEEAPNTPWWKRHSPEYVA